MFVFTLLFISGSSNLIGQQDLLSPHPRQEDPIPDNPFADRDPIDVPFDCDDLDPNDPCPYDNMPIKYVSVNIHFFLTEDGRGNFTETGDGIGGTYNGYQRAQDIVDEANNQLEQNSEVANGLPPNVICKIPIRLLLEGVYFHRSNVALIPNSDPPLFETCVSIKDCGYFSPIWSWFPGQRVNSTTEINCFFINGDSHSGVATGNKLATVHDGWKFYIRDDNMTRGQRDLNSWFFQSTARLLLHEVFHANGLWEHPFGGLDCSDTPTLNPPCWQLKPNDPDCDEWSEISTNLMDYNSYINWSLSACQVCNLYQGFDDDNHYQVKDQNACPPTSSFFATQDEVCSYIPVTDNISIWMEGTASHNESEYDIEIYETDAVGSNQYIDGYANDNFNGQIGLVDLKTHMSYNFECGKVYRIKLSTLNECNDYDEYIKWVTTICGCPMPDGDEVYALVISPNPVILDEALVTFTLDNMATLDVSIHDQFSGSIVGQILENEMVVAGTHTYTFDTGNLPNGLYFVRAVSANNLSVSSFIVNH